MCRKLSGLLPFSHNLLLSTYEITDRRAKNVTFNLYLFYSLLFSTRHSLCFPFTSPSPVQLLNTHSGIVFVSPHVGLMVFLESSQLLVSRFNFVFCQALEYMFFLLSVLHPHGCKVPSSLPFLPWPSHPTCPLFLDIVSLATLTTN